MRCSHASWKSAYVRRESIQSDLVRTVVTKTTSILLVFLLASFGFAFASPYAYAKDIDAAAASAATSQEVLDAAQARLDEISEEYDALKAEIDAIQVKIDALASKVLKAQEAMMDGRISLGNTALYEYRNSSVNTFIEILFGATDFSELNRNMNYLEKLMNSQAKEVAAQRDLREEFASVAEEITMQKDMQDAKLAELTEKRNEALAVVDEAAEKASEDTERLAALRKQADEFIWQQPPANTEKPDDTENDRKDPIAPDAPVVPNPDDNPPSNGEWLTGIASAYGGWSDPTAKDHTATGAPCNDTSTGVAVPVSLPNYWEYLGRTVEISYNGMTVFATVNDTGYMANGARALDLQPGVFSAFIGSTNCYDWGVREVNYRFL